MKDSLNISGYAAAFAVGVREALAYKAELLIWAGSRIAISLLMILIWGAIYSNSQSAQIGGLSPGQMYSYFFLVGGIYGITYSDLGFTLQGDVVDGKIATYLLHPINYSARIFINELGTTITMYVTLFVPLVMLTSLLTHLQITYTTIALLAAELLLAHTISAVLGFIVAMSSVYLGRMGSILHVVDWVTYLLGGGAIPLVVFSSQIRSLLYLSPFPLMFYTPAATLLGTETTSYTVNEIAITSIWLAAMMAFGLIIWRRIRKDMSSAGG